MYGDMLRRLLYGRYDFYGHDITVTGLVTACDIIDQLKGADLGSRLVVPRVMLRSEGDMFLDSVTVDQLSKALGVEVVVAGMDAQDLISKLT